MIPSAETNTASAPAPEPSSVGSISVVRETPFSVPQHKVLDALWLLWEKRRLLVHLWAYGLIVSAVVVFLLPSNYETTMRLMPPDSQSSSGLAILAGMTAKSEIAGSLTSELLGIKSPGAVFVNILEGRTVQDRIITRFDLRKSYRERYWIDARKELANNTDIQEDRKSGVITIKVTDHNPDRAAAIARAYVEELDHLVAGVSTSSARRERIFIEERLKTVKHDLDIASQQLSQYASQNMAIDITAQSKAMVEGAGRLQGELIAAQAELQGVEEIYTANNVRVASLKAHVAELRRQLNKLGGDTDTRDSVKQNSRTELPSIRMLPVLGLRWVELARETKIQETVYELLTRQYELAKIQEAKETTVVRVLDDAFVPEKRSGPSRFLLISAGSLLVAWIAAIWIFGNEAWTNSDPHDRRKLLVKAVAVSAAQKLRWKRFGGLTHQHRKLA